MVDLNADYLKQILPEVCNISSTAGLAIMEIYRSDEFDVRYKTDKSPVTRADMTADAIICERLTSLTPDIPVLSEENSEQFPYSERSKWQTYWLVDPLDGTKGFIERNGYFTVNIALIDQHNSILGVIYVPNTEVLYYAARECGAFKKDQTGCQRIAVHSKERTKPILVASRAHINKPTQQLIDSIAGADTIKVDSSLKCCMVAEGSADIYLRVGPTCEWDTAASQSIVEQAGGFLTDITGKPLEYNQKDSLINPSFVVHTKHSPAWKHLVADTLKQNK